MEDAVALRSTDESRPGSSPGTATKTQSEKTPQEEPPMPSSTRPKRRRRNPNVWYDREPWMGIIIICLFTAYAALLFTVLQHFMLKPPLF